MHDKNIGDAVDELLKANKGDGVAASILFESARPALPLKYEQSNLISAVADTLAQSDTTKTGPKPLGFYVKPSIFEKTNLTEFSGTREPRYGPFVPYSNQATGPTTLLRTTDQLQIKLNLPTYKAERRRMGFFF